VYQFAVSLFYCRKCLRCKAF